MPTLRYLKLITGEEIIGTVDEQNGMVTITDPLMFECGIDEEDPSRRYVYMSRYAPFLGDFKVELEAAKVVFQGMPSDTVSRYYDVSLSYCRRCTDISFKACVSETTEQISSVLEPSAVPGKKKNVVETEELLEKILLVSPGPSKQLH